MNESLIPVSYVNRLIEQATQAGCDTVQILQEAGLSEVSLADLEFVSAKRYAMLYQLVMRYSEDEWFGMFAGGKVPLGSFRMMCLTLLSCNTLQQAIVRAGEFAEICRGMQVKFAIENQGQQALVKLTPVRSCSSAEFEQLLADAEPGHILNSIITWHKFAEWLAGKEIQLKRVFLTYTQDKAGEPLACVHEDNIEYACAINGFEIPAEVLDYPLVQDKDAFMAFLLTAPYHLVTQDPKKLNFAERVRNILKREVNRNMPSAEKLAEQLNMSVTTLRRQLAKENTSYQKLKDECRLEAAIHYLSYLELSNSDIAEKLGFDEPSAFFRSFKKWTGQTPGEFRARQAEKTD